MGENRDTHERRERPRAAANRQRGRKQSDDASKAGIGPDAVARIINAREG